MDDNTFKLFVSETKPQKTLLIRSLSSENDRKHPVFYSQQILRMCAKHNQSNVLCATKDTVLSHKRLEYLSNIRSPCVYMSKREYGNGVDVGYNIVPSKVKLYFTFNQLKTTNKRQILKENRLF